MERSGNFYKAIQLGYILISILIGCMAYNSLYEWQEIEALELDNKKIDEFRKEINNINIQMIKFSLFGETILEWNDKDIEHYHAQRMAMDSMLCRFKATYPAERIDSVRHLLEDKERQMCQIVQILEQQQAINDKIPRQVPVIAQKSVQEQPKKPKRKGFLGIFGKKEEAKPTVTTTMHRSFNRNMRTEQQAQSRRLSVHADSLAARNAELNRQLQGLVVQIDGKVQTDLQKREAEITAMRERSFIQIGGLTGFVILLLVISYIIIHRNANRIKRYKQETADLIERLQQMAKRNEAMIASRKKAVHTITHELRTPLTAITGYAGLMRKDCNTDKTGTYIRNIQESSDRMREMLNTLLNFFRLDNGKEQPNFSACRISAITHTLETEFMPIAINKGLTLTIHCHKDAFVCTDKERILQIGNNLLSNAIKFTENGSVSLRADYDNGLLKLIVEDTGTGMTEEEQQRVFGAFERLSNAAAKDGVGLGLSITRELVGLLKGTVVIHSTKGKGSTFEVAIPVELCTDASALTTSPAETVTAVETTEEATRERFRTELSVAIIDDDPLQLQLLAELLRRSAQPLFHVTTCQHVSQLQHFLHNTTPDYLIMDIEMPETNGIDLLHAIPHNGIHTIAMTAHDRSIEPDLLKAGFEAVLYKPFSKESLYKLFTVNGGLLCPPQSSHDEPSCQHTQFASLLAFAEGDKEAEREILNNIRTELTTHLAHLRRACTTTPDRTLIAHIAHKLLPVLTMTNTDCHEELVLLSPEHIERLTDQQVKSCCQKVEKSLVKLLQEI